MRKKERGKSRLRVHSMVTFVVQEKKVSANPWARGEEKTGEELYENVPGNYWP